MEAKKKKKKKRKNTLDLYRAVYFICLEIHAVMNMVKKIVKSARLILL